MPILWTSSSGKPAASATRMEMLSARSTLSRSVSSNTSIRWVLAAIRCRGKVPLIKEREYGYHSAGVQVNELPVPRASTRSRSKRVLEGRLLAEIGHDCLRPERQGYHADYNCQERVKHLQNPPPNEQFLGIIRTRARKQSCEV